MKITINEPTDGQTEKPYPKLMKSTDCESVVYFTKDKCGISLTDAYGCFNGKTYLNNWDMTVFKDLPDGFSVTLTNGGGDE